jgi:hypothetical protein
MVEWFSAPQYARFAMLVILAAIVPLSALGCRKSASNDDKASSETSLTNARSGIVDAVTSANESCEVESSDMCLAFTRQTSKDNLSLCKGLGGRALLGNKCTPAGSLGSCTHAKDGYVAYFRRGTKNGEADSQKYCEGTMKGVFRVRVAAEVFAEWKPLALPGAFGGVSVNVPPTIKPTLDSPNDVTLASDTLGFNLHLSKDKFDARKSKKEAKETDGFDSFLEESAETLMWRMKEDGGWKYDFVVQTPTKHTCSSPNFVHDVEFARALMLACKSASKS